MTASGATVRRRRARPAPTPPGDERHGIALDCMERVVPLLAPLGL